MKKVTFLTCVLALCTSTMFAQTLEVTTADMDPVAAGGLVYVIEHAESGSVIEFNFDGEVLDYGEGTGIAIKGKTLTFNGINKKNGKRVTIKGLESLFTVGEASVISLNDLIIDGFKNIAIRLSGNSTLNANNCQFSNNYEPLSSKVNNGGVIRVSGSNAFLKNSLFLKNRCGASYGGGAVCAYGDSELRVENCSFVENEGAAGGAIGVNATAKNPSPRVYIANSTFANNIADDRGGAIYMQTATTVDVFSPVIVNCTFVGNLGSNGGALCVWSRSATTMKPTFVNNLFAENYSNTWMDDESRFDIVAFYMAGQVDANNQPLPQTVLPVCKNNLYVAASDGFFADGSNKAVNFDSDVIFAATEQNPWDEGDVSYNHQTSVLSGDMKIAMIVAGNPDAVWVTQGWTFGYQHDFWDKASLQALLSRVPDDKMIIIDLGNDYPKWVWGTEQTWKNHDGFYGKKWIFSYVPNFGGKTPMTGDLQMYATSSAEALHSANAGDLVGFGSAPEGLENNEVVYELLTDMGWTADSIDLDSWLPVYCKARYGGCPAAMDSAWQRFRETVYSSLYSYPRFTWQTVVPDTRRISKLDVSDSFLQGVELFLSCADSLESSPLYVNDAIEYASYYLAAKADDCYKRALKEDSLGNRVAAMQQLDRSVEILLDVDKLLASHPLYRLEEWVDMARDWGKTDLEKDAYEANAKRLITTWGGFQEDYAARFWSGLIKDYYIPRMKLYFSEQRADLDRWEENWIKAPWHNTSTSFEDPLQSAIKLVERYKGE